jgi:methylphosphotriester-DNA--protein-cysteine methyltransferase
MWTSSPLSPTARVSTSCDPSAAYGESPKAYLTRRRIERATHLLRAVNLTITEVCHAVGYTSDGRFSRRLGEIAGSWIARSPFPAAFC